MDLVVRCAQLPKPGQTILAESSTEYSGGKGANQAVAAALAGGSVSMIGAVGSDGFAQRLLHNLRQHDIDCHHVSQRTAMASGLAVISVDAAGQNSIMVVPGANATLTRDDVLAARRLIEQCDVLLVQLEIPLEAVWAGIELAQVAGARVVLDPAPASTKLPAEFLSADLICPNETEAAELTGQQVGSLEEAHLAATALHRLGAKRVAITLGERGTLLSLPNNQPRLILSFPIDAVDTTAAGDAFAGALVVHWAQTDDLPASIRFANAAGGLAASKHGAQASMADRAAIETLVRTNQ